MTFVIGRFRSNTSARISFYSLVIIIVVAFTADFLATSTPLMVRESGRLYSPIVEQTLHNWGLKERRPEIRDWKTENFDFILFAPIPFDPEEIRQAAVRYGPPLSSSVFNDNDFKHWLGTDRLGRDVAAGMIHGFRRSLTIGFLAMLIAGLIGFIFGAAAGFWGDNSLKIHWIKTLIPVSIMIYLLYFITWIFPYRNSSILLVLLFILSALVLFFGNKLIDLLIKRKRRKQFLPLDIITMRTVELIDAVPGLLLILALASVISLPGIWTLVLIIPVVRWTNFTRFIRAEILKVKELNFVKAAYISGQSKISVLLKYVLPEVIGPCLVLFAFGVSSTILLESTLSFLGIGVPVETVTWGSMLNAARYNFGSWWLAIFPGLAIFCTVTILNLIGDGILQAIDPKKHV